MMLGGPTLLMVLMSLSVPLKLLTLSGWKSVTANMIGGSNNAGESSVMAFAMELHVADTAIIVDSIGYYCLGEPLPIHLNSLFTSISCWFLNNTALGCTLINEGSAPQQDGTLKDCAIPAGITAPNSKRQSPDFMRVIRWEA